MIKFRVRDPETKEIVVYERIKDGRREWCLAKIRCCACTPFGFSHRSGCPSYKYQSLINDYSVGQWHVGIIPLAGPYIYEQWTGLKDKNDVEIYVGDILDCPYTRDGCKHKQLVEWVSGGFKVAKIGKCDQKQVTHRVTNLDLVAIIGSIHDKEKSK